MTLNSETLKTLICPLNHLVYKHTYYHTPMSTVYIEPPREFHPSFFLINTWMVSDHDLMYYCLCVCLRVCNFITCMQYDEQEKWVYAENFQLKQTNSPRNTVQQLHITHFYVLVVLRGHKDFTRNL